MSPRLIMAIFSTLLEEAAVVVLVLWGLPQAGVVVPLAGLIVLMVAWIGFSVFIYHMGSRALRRPVVDLPVAVGSKCKVIRRLEPEGIVGVKGEIWEAKSAHGNAEVGEKVIVIGNDGLKLIVSPKRPGEEDGAE
ncbi:MAG: NfeD family protein [Chloroflexi bacterium]|nr:NfeD family protein [Chloroflexota bacterium]